jgi:ribosomal protein S12 methylthiotransferase accessory factor
MPHASTEVSQGAPGFEAMSASRALDGLSRLAATVMPGSSLALVKWHSEGSHRSEKVTGTLDRILDLAPKAGITRICNVTGLDRVGIPVVMTVRPASRTLSVWQGKSNTLVGAKVSGIMEAVETACAESPPRANERASVVELGSSAPSSLFARSPRASSIRRQRMGWLRGYDLVARKYVYVPRDLVALAPAQKASRFFSELGTNGLAAGNDVIEAALHGICELIERDAEALWHSSPDSAKRATHLDLTTVADPLCLDVLSRLRNASIAVQVFDITSDLAVPSYFALIDDWDAPAFRLGRFGGTGCHPVAEVALFRALCEAAQSRLTFIVGAREDIALANYLWTDASRLLAPLLDLYARSCPRRFSPEVGHRCSDIAEDLRWIMGRLAACRIRNVIAVDLSRDDLKIPVVRVIAPGLENLRHQTVYCQGRRARLVARGSAR